MPHLPQSMRDGFDAVITSYPHLKEKGSSLYSWRYFSAKMSPGCLAEFRLLPSFHSSPHIGDYYFQVRNCQPCFYLMFEPWWAWAHEFKNHWSWFSSLWKEVDFLPWLSQAMNSHVQDLVLRKQQKTASCCQSKNRGCCSEAVVQFVKQDPAI